MGPDPEKLKRDNFQQGDLIINQLEEEQMDVDVEENMGYMPLQDNDHELPANDCTDDDDEEEEGSDDENEYTFQAADNAPSDVIPIVTSSAQAEIWNAPRPNPTAIELTKERSQQITQIMSKINLPNPPAWINDISTETLVNRLKNQ